MRRPCQRRWNPGAARAGTAKRVREQVRAVDPGATLAYLATTDEVIPASVAGRRFRAHLHGASGGPGLLLAVADVYGLIA